MIVMGLFDNVENFSLVKKYFFNRILKVYDKFIFWEIQNINLQPNLKIICIQRFFTCHSQ